MTGNNEIFSFIQNQMEQILDEIRDHRQEIGNIKKEMVSRQDLKEIKESFSKSFEEIYGSIKTVETEIENIVTSVDEIEDKVKISSDFVKTFKGAFKWLALSLGASLLSSLASLIPVWVSQHQASTSHISISSQNNSSDTQPEINTQPHLHVHVNLSH